MEKDIYIRMAIQEKYHWWFSGRRAIIKQLIEKYSPGHELTILEAGCGTGGNLDLLSEFGSIDAFEIDSDACQMARNTGHPVKTGWLPDNIPFKDKRYDIIALFDVLEHVKEDRQSIKALAKLLKPNGRMYVTVPAHPILWSNHDVKHHHFRRYRKSILKDIFEEAGLVTIRISYYNFFLFPLVSMMRINHNIFKYKKSDDETVPPSWLNNLLFSIFSIEKFILSRANLPLGISLIAVVEPT